MRIVHAVSLLVGALLLAGCGANHNSIYRYQPVEAAGTSLTMVDAKQRAIIHAGSKTCTEPPPDVFSVYAQSLAASGAVSKSADPTSLGVSGSLAYSSSEQGATISRTQAFNLLTLQTYYNCLSSLNGDGSKLDAPIDRARLQRLMVSVLAIEQLTGALRPPVVVIGASGSAGSTAGEAVVRIDDALKSVQAAKANLVAAKAKRDDLDKADPKCAALAASVAGGTVLTGDDLKKRNDCVAADTLVDTATTNSSTAAAHYEALKNAGGGNSNIAETKVIEAKVIAAAARDEETVRQVAEVIHKIVDANMQQDETKFFCIRLLGDDKIRETVLRGQSGPSGANLTEQCSSFLLATVKSDEDRLFKLMGNDAQQEFLQQKTEAAGAIGTATDAAFDGYWRAVKDPATGLAVPAIVAAKIDPIVSANTFIPPILARMTALRAATNETTARAIFRTLPPQLQTLLAQ